MWSLPHLKDRVAARRRSKPLAIIEVSALAGVLVAVLFAFMGMIPTGSHHRAAVDLPLTRSGSPMPGALREDALQVIVMRDGAIYLDHHAVLGTGLSDEIRRALRHGAERRVYLRADSRVKYSDVEVVLDAIRAAGVQDVSVLTERQQ